MRLPLLTGFTATAVLAIAAVASPAAHAGRVTVGASLGLTQAENDDVSDPNDTIGLFARVGLVSQLSAQLDISRVDTDASSGNDLRQATALAVLDLGGKRLVPILLAGVGVDYMSNSYSDSVYHHFEAGVGLEYRALGGLVIGADVRIGTRTLDSSSDTPGPLYGCNCTADIAQSFSEGQYRNVRLTVGYSF